MNPDCKHCLVHEKEVEWLTNQRNMQIRTFKEENQKETDNGLVVALPFAYGKRLTYLVWHYPYASYPPYYRTLFSSI